MNNRIGDARRRYAQVNGRFTQEDAAAFFGVSLSTYKKWEQGKGMMNGSQLRAIAQKYGVTVDYLLMVKPKDGSIYLSQEEGELLGIYRLVTDEGKQQLLVYARGVAVTYSKSDTTQKAV